MGRAVPRARPAFRRFWSPVLLALGLVLPAAAQQSRRFGTPATVLAFEEQAALAAQPRPAVALADIVSNTPRIVVATVRRSEARETESGNIFTFTDFETSELVKGDLPKQFTLRIIGGQVGTTVVEASHAPRFVPGQEVVLFLGNDNQYGFPTINPELILEVQTVPGTTTKMVSSPPAELPLFRAADGRASSDRSGGPVRLEDFVYSLRQLR